MHLPPEILEQIFAHTPIGYHGQLDLWSFCLVSRLWYASAIKRLYHSPSVIGKNFDAFANTLCPSVNANVRRTELALFVHQLNMSKLVYNGSKSLTARVLGRVKGQLEVFVAPAATFSLLAFSALAKCYHLRLLNLEYVIERLDVVQLLRTIGKLPSLRNLSLRTVWANPRTNAKKGEVLELPASLRQFYITGISDPGGELVLYDAMTRSKIHTLSVMLGGTHLRALDRVIFNLPLVKLRIDMGVRSSSGGDMEQMLLVSDMLYNSRDMEELSIPLICLDNIFFTSPGLNDEPPWNLRSLTVHGSQIEIVGGMFYGGGWQGLIENIISGHLQYLEQIIVEEVKDVRKLEEMEEIRPGCLRELHEALFDEETDDSGLFLAGRGRYD